MTIVPPSEIPPATVLTPEEAAARMTPDQMAQYVERPRRGAGIKILGAILIAGVGLGASALSCVGQSFSLRQARALEGIEQHLLEIERSYAQNGAEGAR
jgi:hypothetical protein